MPLEYALQFIGAYPTANPWSLGQSRQQIDLGHSAHFLDMLPKQTVKVTQRRPLSFNIMVAGAFP
jgi:hypothetical protein